MGSPDPWQVLGVAPGVTVEEARAARRRLAKDLHPDLHGGRSDAERAQLADRMTIVNWALDQIEQVAGQDGVPHPDDPWTTTPSSPEAAPTTAAAAAADAAAVVAAPVPGDPGSFSLERLPAEAFEALFVATYGLGDILCVDEPYLLEVFLNDPACFCRLSLVPEAGGSLVTVDVSPAMDTMAAPDPTTVVAVLTAELNSLLQA